MNAVTGKERRRLNFLLKSLKYQQQKWGECEVRAARVKDLEKELKKKK